MVTNGSKVLRVYEMAPKRPRRPINRSPMSGSFKTPKKGKKTVVGESPAFQQLINQQLEALMPEIVNHVSAQMGNGTHQEGAGTGGSVDKQLREIQRHTPKHYLSGILKQQISQLKVKN
ncbi:hypothetical protein CTI12_AA112910 [Artemisia annua]|uniref:Uncharacterized protein n=1 Tax=Artemisia annua TaxID=35608 RepID=A0A2U1N025_ARTAN|nr:hypothetical protein CTI12_AA112910 [Artemisia annua]